MLSLQFNSTEYTYVGFQSHRFLSGLAPFLRLELPTSKWQRSGIVFSFMVASMPAYALLVQEITSNRYQWKKPIDNFEYSRVASFGRNIIVSDGDEWKHHRKIVNPAFSEVSLSVFR